MPKAYDTERIVKDEETPEGNDPISHNPKTGQKEMPRTEEGGDAFDFPREAKAHKASMKHKDKSPGPGYFGTLTDKDGDPLNHAEIEVRMAGEKHHIPLLTPNQDREDIENVLKGGKPSDKMKNRAIDHGISRLGEGRSLTKEEGEKTTKLPNPSEEDFKAGFASR